MWSGAHAHLLLKIFIINLLISCDEIIAGLIFTLISYIDLDISPIFNVFQVNKNKMFRELIFDSIY